MQAKKILMDFAFSS